MLSLSKREETFKTQTETITGLECFARFLYT